VALEALAAVVEEFDCDQPAGDLDETAWETQVFDQLLDCLAVHRAHVCVLVTKQAPVFISSSP